MDGLAVSDRMSEGSVVGGVDVIGFVERLFVRFSVYMSDVLAVL